MSAVRIYEGNIDEADRIALIEDTKALRKEYGAFRSSLGMGRKEELLLQVFDIIWDEPRMRNTLLSKELKGRVFVYASEDRDWGTGFRSISASLVNSWVGANSYGFTLTRYAYSLLFPDERRKMDNMISSAFEEYGIQG